MQDELDVPSPESTPFGVRLLICFLVLDGVRRLWEIRHGTGDLQGPPVPVYVLWALIDLLLALLMVLRTRAGRYWTQAILLVHVFYLGYTLGFDRPYLWLAMGGAVRARVLATLFVDGLFVAYLASGSARAYLDEGP